MEVMSWSWLGRSAKSEVGFFFSLVYLGSMLISNREHVYRRHVLPIRCMRCFENFKDEATLGQHAQADAPCKRPTFHPTDTLEGCDKDQEKRLKCRKRKPGETEEDRWTGKLTIMN
jgi:hypothetical protein